MERATQTRRVCMFVTTIMNGKVRPRLGSYAPRCKSFINMRFLRNQIPIYVNHFTNMRFLRNLFANFHL